MAKVFGGFTPEQMGKIVPEMAGMQADEQQAYIMSQPGAAKRVGKMAEVAMRQLGAKAMPGMAEGGYVQGGLVNQAVQGLVGVMPELAQGDTAAFENFLGRPALPTPVQPVGSRPPSKLLYEQGISQPSPAQFDPNDPNMFIARPAVEPYQPPPDYSGMTFEQAQMRQAQRNIKSPEEQAAINAALQGGSGTVKPDEEGKTEAVVNNTPDNIGGLVQQSIQNPTSMTTKTEVETMSDADKASGTITSGTGEQGVTTDATATTAEAGTPVTAPTKTEAATVDPTKATPAVTEATGSLDAAVGKVSEGAKVEAASQDPEKLAALGLDVEQIDQAQTVDAPDPRTVQEGEMIDGSTVDMDRVRTEVNFEAVTGAPSTDATVQGQLTGLMADFEGKSPPAWAAGAMRNAAAAMAARGLSSSSMAGQAMIQTAMEAALPIAQMDSQTFAKFESQNLSNRQQTAMFAAEKRAEFLGLEFNQEFQSRVANAAKISDIANMNFSAEQSIALENARMAQTVDLTNLNATNAKVMADAAAMSQADMANLNNRQQAAIQNAQNFMQMDMANLNNEQQTSMFKVQANINAMMSDTAAENAAKQFNASSENQTNQFFADLSSRIQQFNSDQESNMNRFNAGESNALSQFNSAQLNMRDQFNATNRLVIAQANAKWAQETTTAENAAINDANRADAVAANQFTQLGYNATIQTYRDLMSFANTTANNNADRATQIMLANIAADASKYGSDATANQAAAEAKSEKDAAFWGAVGGFFSSF